MAMMMVMMIRIRITIILSSGSGSKGGNDSKGANGLCVSCTRGEHTKSTTVQITHGGSVLRAQGGSIQNPPPCKLHMRALCFVHKGGAYKIHHRANYT